MYAVGGNKAVEFIGGYVAFVRSAMQCNAPFGGWCHLFDIRAAMYCGRLQQRGEIREEFLAHDGDAPFGIDLHNTLDLALADDRVGDLRVGVTTAQRVVLYPDPVECATSTFLDTILDAWVVGLTLVAVEQHDVYMLWGIALKCQRRDKPSRSTAQNTDAQLFLVANCTIHMYNFSFTPIR